MEEPKIEGINALACLANPAAAVAAGANAAYILSLAGACNIPAVIAIVGVG